MFLAAQPEQIIWIILPKAAIMRSESNNPYKCETASAEHVKPFLGHCDLKEDTTTMQDNHIPNPSQEQSESPSGLTKKLRFEVFKRDSFTCQYCGRSAPDVTLQVDHIDPKANNGTNDILNLITSCFDCNQGKKDRLLSDQTVIQKRKAQLDQLQERREQLEMLMEWQQGLLHLNDEVLQGVYALWQQLNPGYSLGENALKTF